MSAGGRVGGRLVRQAKDSAASAKYGEVWGRGRRGMKTPGGKDDERKRMYHPRFGRWTVQMIVDVALSCTLLPTDRNRGT